MRVELIHFTPLHLTDHAIGMCWAAGDYDRDKAIKRMQRVALQSKHESVLEFIGYTFDIEASTKVLLEMTRHRHASYAVQSSRYTLNKCDIIYESTGKEKLDKILELQKNTIIALIESGEYSNDELSLLLPQAFQYKWTCQFNARSLRNFLKLRRAKGAHLHIRDVAEAMYKALPDSHKFLFEDTK